jgi:hypothetical protein
MYIDYLWDLTPAGLIIDKELNTKKIGWNPGDYFCLVVDQDGQQRLARLNVLENFLIDGVLKKDNNKD